MTSFVSSKTFCALHLGLALELGLGLRLKLAEVRFRSNVLRTNAEDILFTVE